jgi:hypothetical protein
MGGTWREGPTHVRAGILAGTAVMMQLVQSELAGGYEVVVLVQARCLV